MKISLFTEEIKKPSLKNYDILYSVSIFKLKKPYSEFENYIEGLRQQVNYFEKYNKKSIVYRIYYDHSLDNDKDWSKLLKFFLKKDYVQIYKYYCPEIIKNGFHDGLFGTFVRFLPLFESDKERNWKVMGCLDVDLNKRNIERIDLLNNILKFQKSNYSFAVFQPKCYYLTPHLFNLKDKIKNLPFILAGAFLSKITFNKKIFFDFLNNIASENKKYKFLKERLRKRVNEEDRFLYGMDEYFLTVEIGKEIVKKKKKILFLKNYVSYAKSLKIIFKQNNYFRNIKSEKEIMWKKLVKKILTSKYENDKTLFENYKIMIEYSYCELSERNEKFCKKISKEFSKIFDNKEEKKYKIPYIVKKCIYRE